SQKQGRLGELFAKPQLRSTLIGVTLATVGLVTFWGIHIYGKNALMRNTQAEVLNIENIATDADKAVKAAAYEKHKAKIKTSEMLSMTFNTIGGGLGLILFGTISNRLGRKGAFVMYHAVAFVMVIILFKVLIPNPETSNLTYMLFLPIFGFFTLGMHAGYAVYFPELYPTRLRGTGAGFCFNMGRLGTAAAFFFFGSLATPLLPEQQALLLSPLYIVGLVVILFGKETRGEELPD
ncbi:MAG: MFS transporter, partial [Verrucomicrobia bacterium]|nr:MFS transporter [Verrucomicrobiota bacterium]